MVRNHGWRRDVAITDKIGPTTTSGNLIVRFGQRGRVGEAAIKPRARFAVGELAPWVNLTTEVDNLPAPIAMRAGDSWAGNLVLPAPPGMAGPLALRTPLDLAADRALLERAIVGRRHGHWTPNERWLRR